MGRRTGEAMTRKFQGPFAVAQILMLFAIAAVIFLAGIAGTYFILRSRA